MNIYHTTSPITATEHDVAMEQHCDMVCTMLDYAFATITDVSCDAMEALEAGLYVVARCNNHYAVEIVAIIAIKGLASLVFEHCGSGHMLLDPDGVVSYATPQSGLIAVTFN